jgi:hypothetical protein
MTRRNIEKPNPLDFFGVREVNVLPPHFETINFVGTIYNLEQTFSKWITENLKGRYYIGQTTILDDTNQYKKVIQIGFEEPKELSYFSLACPHLKYK